MSNNSTCVYLDSLDSSSVMTLSGETYVIDITDSLAYDSSLYYNIPMADISNIWKFWSDDLVDSSGIKINANQSGKFIHAAPTDALYHKGDVSDNSFNLVYDKQNNVNEPVAATDFLEQLALQALGTRNPDVAFSNVPELLVNYGDTVTTVCENINNKFTDTSFTDLSDIVISSAPQLKAGQLVYNWLREHHDDRFMLGYKMVGDISSLAFAISNASGEVDFSNSSFSCPDAIIPAMIGGTIDASGIRNALNIESTGSGYEAGSDASFNVSTLNGTVVATFTGTLNSVGAAQLNGNLSSDEGVEFPLEPGDKLQIVMRIKAHSDQRDVSGDILAPFHRDALLEMTIRP